MSNANGAAPLTLSVVKSAARVLEVLEFFSTTQRPASVTDVVKALELPQSSASMLLRSLVVLGYLEYLAETRRFRPTLRATLLGDWIAPSLFEGPVTERLAALQRTTGETVLLGRRQGADLQYAFAVQPDSNVQLLLRPGLKRPMSRTALGRALLSQMPEASARRIIRRNNADAERPEHRVDEAQAVQQLREIRRTGLAESDAHGATRDAHVIGALLPKGPETEPLAVGVGGPAARILLRREAIIEALRQWLAEGRARAG